MKTLIAIVSSVLKGLIAYYVNTAVRQYQKIIESSDVTDKAHEMAKQELSDFYRQNSDFMNDIQNKVWKGIEGMNEFDRSMGVRLEKKKELDRELGI